MATAPLKSDLLAEFGAPDARVREEAWRYSKPALRALAQQDFAAADADAVISESLRARYAWPQTRGRRAVFVNGAFAAAESDLALCGDAIAIRRDGTHRCVATVSGDIAEPLHLVYLNIPSPTPSRWNARCDIEVRAGKAQLIEQHLGEAGADVLGAVASQIRIAAAAALQFTTLVELPDCVSVYRRAQTDIAADALFDTSHILLGGRLQRHDIAVELSGAQSQHRARGVFALGGRQHADTHLDVRHVARDTACDIVWRGVADQRSRGVFHGAITVAEGADGADARLSNKNLLLSAQAEIDTQPVLEIYADEVKAAHGATVGQIDERALFYLRSRGIAAADARRLLIGAFCDVALDRIAQPWLREHIVALLAPRLVQARA